MLHRHCVVLILVLMSGLAARSSEAKDGESIQGTWLASTAELGGKPFPEEVRKSIKLTVKDGKYTVMVGKNPDRGTTKLDPSAKPKAMDITGTEGPNKGKTFQAIYELDGDTIEGTWLPATAELGGKPFPDEVRKTIKLVVKDGKYTVTVGKEIDQGTVKLNPAAKPKEMDITGTDGPNKGKTFLNSNHQQGKWGQAAVWA